MFSKRTLKIAKEFMAKEIKSENAVCTAASENLYGDLTIIIASLDQSTPPKNKFRRIANTRFSVENTPENRARFTLKGERPIRACVQITNGKLGLINKTGQASVLQETSQQPTANTSPVKLAPKNLKAWKKYKKQKDKQKASGAANAGLLFFKKYNETPVQKSRFTTSAAIKRGRK